MIMELMARRHVTRMTVGPFAWWSRMALPTLSMARSKAVAKNSLAGVTDDSMLAATRCCVRPWPVGMACCSSVVTCVRMRSRKAVLAALICCRVMPWAPMAVVRRLKGSRVTVRSLSLGGISLSLLLARRGEADPASRGVGIALAVASPVLVRAVHPGSRMVLGTSAAATRLDGLARARDREGLRIALQDVRPREEERRCVRW
jgi:hypothetical protein